ncbi:MAG: TIGR03915 family putative DNA repair protein [Chitinophagales bacterium]|nr:TIGR03915 family putative DNA repair protein [Chitinophagales bacterium]
MDCVLYDGSFEGFLTAVFEVYEYKLEDPEIVNENLLASNLFGKQHIVKTDTDKAARVMKKIGQLISTSAISQLYKTFLSELRGIECCLYRYIQYAITSKLTIENNFSHPDVLLVQQTSRKVHREKHRMEAFVRFQLTKDGLYYAIIQPDFNVLPLISHHFESRYADQRWLIYDALRKFGIYYDLHTVEQVQLTFSEEMTAGVLQEIHDDNEDIYQALWRQYFSSVNIAARKNLKLHIRHMPKRYWKYLTEKQPFSNT